MVYHRPKPGLPGQPEAGLSEVCSRLVFLFKPACDGPYIKHGGVHKHNTPTGGLHPPAGCKNIIVKLIIITGRFYWRKIHKYRLYTEVTVAMTFIKPRAVGACRPKVW